MRGRRSLRSLPFRAHLCVQVAFEGVQRLRPQGLVLRDPLIKFCESLRVEFVDSLLCLHLDVHEPRVAEHLEVARHAGLCEVREPRGDVPSLPAAARKEVEDRSPGRVRDRQEHIRHERPHPNLFSSSAKKALYSRTKSASLNRTSSPALSFSTDFSGGSVIPELAELGHPGNLSTCTLPWFSRSELHSTRTSFNGLPSLPSVPVSRWTNM